MPSFFFRKLQFITVLLLICDSYMSWSTRFVSLKLCVGFPFSIPFCFYQSLYLCWTKYMDSLTLKRHNSFQNKNNRKATHSFAPRSLSSKLQQKVRKSKDICMSWSSPKTDMETNFLNLYNQSLSTSLFSIVT